MDALAIVAPIAPRSVRVSEGAAACAVFLFEKYSGFLFGMGLLKKEIDAVLAIGISASVLQNRIYIFLGDRKSGGLFRLRFLQYFLLLLDRGEGL